MAELINNEVFTLKSLQMRLKGFILSNLSTPLVLFPSLRIKGDDSNSREMLLQDNSQRWKPDSQTVPDIFTQETGVHALLPSFCFSFAGHCLQLLFWQKTETPWDPQLLLCSNRSFSRTLFKYPHYTVFSRLRYRGHELGSLDRKYPSILSNGDRRTEQLKKSFLHSFSHSLPLPLWISHTLSLSHSLSHSLTHSLSLCLSLNLSLACSRRTTWSVWTWFLFSLVSVSCESALHQLMTLKSTSPTL